MGIGPLALHLGAEEFWYREPDLHRSVIESPEVKRRYFEPMLEELEANYGPHVDLGAWHRRVVASRPPPDTKEAVDMTMSSSVLEHVPRRGLPTFLSDLSDAARPGSWFVHLVDFGPHGHGPTMAGLYAVPHTDGVGGYCSAAYLVQYCCE